METLVCQADYVRHFFTVVRPKHIHFNSALFGFRYTWFFLEISFFLKKNKSSAKNMNLSTIDLIWNSRMMGTWMLHAAKIKINNRRSQTSNNKQQSPFNRYQCAATAYSKNDRDNEPHSNNKNKFNIDSHKDSHAILVIAIMIFS